MARKATIIGTATDYVGQRWDVRESRYTPHGFTILIGWPQGAQRGQGGRGTATILSVELAQYLANTRPRDVNLPISRTTWKRLRSELGLAWDWNQWWHARQAALSSMTLERFAQTHGCSVGAASQRRAALRTHTVAAQPYLSNEAPSEITPPPAKPTDAS